MLVNIKLIHYLLEAESDLEADLDKVASDLEDSLKKSTASNSELTDVKIKIIKLDSASSELNSQGFNSILSSLMQDNSQIKNIERMNDNYKFVVNAYDGEFQDEIDNEEEETQFGYDMIASSKHINKNKNLVQQISVSEFLNAQKENDDELEKLIIF